MAYTAKADGVWIDRAATGGGATSNLIDAGDCNRWEDNQADSNTRLVALEGAASSTTVVHNSQTGTTYTLVLGDAGKVVEMNNAAANTLTVPPNASVPFPVGTFLSIRQYGAGQTTIAQGAGVTINSYGGGLRLAGRYSEATLTKRATNEWILSGETSV